MKLWMFASIAVVFVLSALLPATADAGILRRFCWRCHRHSRHVVKVQVATDSPVAAPAGKAAADQKPPPSNLRAP